MPLSHVPLEYIEFFRDRLARAQVEMEQVTDEHETMTLFVGVNRARVLCALQLSTSANPEPEAQPGPLDPQPPLIDQPDLSQISSSQEFNDGGIKDADLGEFLVDDSAVALPLETGQSLADLEVRPVGNRNRRKIQERKARRERERMQGEGQAPQQRRSLRTVRLAKRRQTLPYKSATRVDDLDDADTEDNDSSEAGQSEGESESSPAQSEGEGESSPAPPDAHEWIIKTIQDMPSNKRPDIDENKRQKLIDMAMAIGNLAAVKGWQQIYKHWRHQGDLRLPMEDCQESSASHGGMPSHLVNRRGELAIFYFAYHKVKQAKISQLLYAILYRVTLASLHDAYQNAELAVGGTSTPGVSYRSQAKQELFNVVYPGHETVAKPSANPSTKSLWTEYGHQLQKAQRWHYMRENLGMGVLGLILEKTVTNTWVERGLLNSEFYLWVSIVQHSNQLAIEAGRLLQDLMVRAIQGKKIHRKKLALEEANFTMSDLVNISKMLCFVPDGTVNSGDEMPQGPH